VIELNYSEGNTEFLGYLKSKGVKSHPHIGFFNLASKYFGISTKIVEQRIRAMHRTELIENDGQNWVIK